MGQLPRYPSPSPVALQLHGLGPAGGGLSSLHILGSSFLIVERCCITHDLPNTCALSCYLRTGLHIHLGREAPPGGSHLERPCVAWGFIGIRSLNPPHRCKAESIPGRVTRPGHWEFPESCGQGRTSIQAVSGPWLVSGLLPSLGATF